MVLARQAKVEGKAAGVTKSVMELNALSTLLAVIGMHVPLSLHRWNHTSGPPPLSVTFLVLLSRRSTLSARPSGATHTS